MTREPKKRGTEFFERNRDNSLANITDQLRLRHDALVTVEVFSGYPTAFALDMVGLTVIPSLAVFDELLVVFYNAMVRIVADEF